MEEEYDGLQQSASQAATRLRDTETNLEDRKEFCRQLQEECESMTEHVGDWAEKQRCVCVCVCVRACVHVCCECMFPAGPIQSFSSGVSGTTLTIQCVRVCML